MARYGILLLIMSSVLAVIIHGQSTGQCSQCTDNTQLKELVSEGLTIDKQNMDINKENLDLNKKTFEAVSSCGQSQAGQTVTQCPGACNGQLFLSDYNPVGYNLDASSMAQGHPVESSVLNTISSTKQSCWAAAKNDASQWIQVSLRVLHKVMAVLTQGRYAGDGTAANYLQWVTKYTISYSTDYITWTNYTDTDQSNNQPKVFDGNKSGLDLKLNMFLTPFVARYVRLHPTAWNVHISLRWDILACSV